MKQLMRYVTYGLPFILLFIGLFADHMEVNRAQVCVPLLALFPFIYLLQGILVTFYGGSLLIAAILTSFSYLVTLLFFLDQSSWIYILGYLIIALFVGAILEYRHRT
ncbi:MAG: hypothetical protein K2G70_03760 [Turicibacter sp.]|nr:hypothetical protein [Turicibacter sp.]